MDTATIEAFLAVVRHGSLTEAANSLFISQSTLSHRLMELERDVGMTLIDRGRGIRSMTLTDCGKEFLLVAKRWENLVQDTQQIRSQTKKISLSIGAVDTFHSFVFPQLYQMLRKQMPELSLRLKTYNSTELYLQVDRGEIDVAFPLLDLSLRNIVVEKFYSEPRVILRKEQHPGNFNEFIDPECLDMDKEIFFEADPIFHAWYQRWKGERGYPTLRVDTAQLLLQLLNIEGTWSVVPLCVANKIVSTGSFSYYRLHEPPPERVCYKIRTQWPKASVLEGIAKLDSCLALLFK
ncbi:MAG: LysR substrate-binding domain-containing protein [Negativicutes bacterium]